MVHDLSAKPTDVDTAWIAAGKKLCGMCKYKEADKWLCMMCHSLACPVNDAEAGCAFFLKKPSAPRPPQPKKKGLPVAPGVTFLYFGRPGAPGAWHEGDRAHQGVVTVAIDKNSVQGVLHMGFSFCSPKDRWCKITGRDMAMDRLYDDPLVIPYLYDHRRTALDVIRAVLTHNRRLTAFADAVPPLLKVPDWTRGLAIYKLPKSAAIDIENLPVHIMARMLADIAKLGE